MSIDDETLMAFADGELPAAERAAVEEALAHDETLVAKLAAHRSLGARLSSAFDGALGETTPQRLTDAAKPPRDAEIIAFAPRDKVRWSYREVGAMAASVAIGLVIGVGVMQRPQPMLVTSANGLTSNGAQTSALNRQLASDEAGAVRIGLSFRAHDGAYCRTFDLTEGGASGVACHGETGWSVPLISRNASGGEIRTAGASAEVLNAVDRMIAGDPLDAEAERAARAGNWR